MATRDEIAAFNETFSSALASGDFERIETLYAEDAQFIAATAPTVKGRAAIIAMMEARHHVSPTVLTVASGDVWESGDLVVDVGTCVIEGDSPIHGRELVVYRRNAHGTLELLLDVPINDPSLPTND